jgi:uncharacterized coiled-coil protein SlyX
MKNPKRMKELEVKKQFHEQKAAELREWILKNWNHPDKSKVYSDKAHHESQIELIKKKLNNLQNNLPELGKGTYIDPQHLDRKTSDNATY